MPPVLICCLSTPVHHAKYHATFLLTAKSHPAILTSEKQIPSAFLCGLGDQADLANGILGLRNDERLREKIGTNGYKYFEKNYSVEAIGQGILKIIHKII